MKSVCRSCSHLSIIVSHPTMHLIFISIIVYQVASLLFNNKNKSCIKFFTIRIELIRVWITCILLFHTKYKIKLNISNIIQIFHYIRLILTSIASIYYNLRIWFKNYFFYWIFFIINLFLHSIKKLLSGIKIKYRVMIIHIFLKW